MGVAFANWTVSAVKSHAFWDLVAWDELSEEARDKDTQFVRGLPRLLADAGFQIIRLPSGAS